MHKKSILQKSIQVVSTSLFSKLLGIIRDVVQMKYLGVGVYSDAFAIAYKIPNSLRKVFAEGALSAAFIPTLVSVVSRRDYEQASKLMSLILFVISCIVLTICLGVLIFPQNIILLYAPGFAYKPAEFALSIPLLQILIFFIFFISLSALFAGALQARQHFSVPAWGPVILNIIYITGLLLSIYLKLSIIYFSYFILLGGFMQLLMHIYMYKKLDYKFLWPDKQTFKNFYAVAAKFLPCLISMSAMELNSFVDARFASNLEAGALTLTNLAFRFMGIVFSSFSVVFSTIFLSHFSRISTYAPKRLSFYLFESAKLILWGTLPIILLMSFFSYDIFYTIFFRITGQISLAQTQLAAQLLIAFLTGLFFFSLNKLLLSIYYSLHNTSVPTVITLIGTLFNIICNRLFIPYWGALGIALGTSVAAGIETILFIIILHQKFNFVLYTKKFFYFVMQYLVQISLTSVLFYIAYKLCVKSIIYFMPGYTDILLHSILLWLWVGPLCLIIFGLLYKIRKFFKIKLYFLD